MLKNLTWLSLVVPQKDKNMALDYSARYYKLAGVKECIYHPSLPTFRRMDMDTAAHKLPDEHCRTTTPCTRGDFSHHAAPTHLKKPDIMRQTFPSTVRHWRYRNLYSYRLGQDAEKDHDSPGVKYSSNDARTKPSLLRGRLYVPAYLKHLISELNEVDRAQMPKTNFNPAVDDLKVSKLGQQPWKFVLQQEPFIDHIGQRPIPATAFSRYRSTSSVYGGQASSRSWRP